MSYILDALRKSETERRQGRVPDLGQQVQLVHKPRKKTSSVLVWVGVGLILNAGVLAYLFWPATNSGSEAGQPAPVSGPRSEPEPIPVPAPQTEPAPGSEGVAVQESEPEPESVSEGEAERSSTPAELGDVTAAPDRQAERPTIIVPSRRDTGQSAAPNSFPSGRVPHLVELPLGFQKSVPDLIFNSHIYASDPSARRVMINNNYLRVNDSFSGLRVEQITEEGVVLSSNGQSFRVGIVRDWVSPD